MSPRAQPPAARGVLRGPAPEGRTKHQRLLPTPALAAHIAHFWWVAWDLREPLVVETLPHPTVHLTFERHDDGERARTRAEVGGLSSSRFRRTLKGRGRVFGIKFRPAAFAPLWRASAQQPMSALADRTTPLRTLFDPPAIALSGAMAKIERLEDGIEIAEAFLNTRLRPLPAPIVALRDLVERLESDRTILRVQDAAALFDVDVRTLQRRFARHVGVSPKWVIQRYRLHEAALRLEAARPPTLAQLAAELGYFDQSHFVQDFKQVTGRSPGQTPEPESASPRDEKDE